mmetsp:Transcript_1160/g.1876  ORF Transcript_1160/g.1876 Transcript_1160/m.1876 type:complete len:175 (+) Transcript_1160:121-645(+)
MRHFATQLREDIPRITVNLMQRSVTDAVQEQFQEERRREANHRVRTALELDPEALRPFGMTGGQSDQNSAHADEVQQTAGASQGTYSNPFSLENLWGSGGNIDTLIEEMVNIWVTEVLPRIEVAEKSKQKWYVSDRYQTRYKSIYKHIFDGVRCAAKSDDRAVLLRTARGLDEI